MSIITSLRLDLLRRPPGPTRRGSADALATPAPSVVLASSLVVAPTSVCGFLAGRSGGRLPREAPALSLQRSPGPRLDLRQDSFCHGTSQSSGPRPRRPSAQRAPASPLPHQSQQL